MQTEQTSETMATAIAKLAPPVTFLTAKYAGLTVPEWIQLLTLGYIVLLIAHKLWQMGLEAWKFWRTQDKDAP